MSHDDFRKELVQKIIDEGMKTSILLTPAQSSKKYSTENAQLDRVDVRLVERHFPCNIPPKLNAKCKKPSRKCIACSDVPYFENNKRVSQKYTSYWCKLCKIPLCIQPCFKIYHCNKNYKQAIIDMHLGNAIENGENQIIDNGENE